MTCEINDFKDYTAHGQSSVGGGAGQRSDVVLTACRPVNNDRDIVYSVGTLHLARPYFDANQVGVLVFNL